MVKMGTALFQPHDQLSIYSLKASRGSPVVGTSQCSPMQYILGHKHPCIFCPIYVSSTTIYSGRLRYGSTILRTAAVSVHEYHLHLICISVMRSLPICFVLHHEPASSYQASDRFAEQKTVVFDSMKQLIKMFDTSASQILLEEVDLIMYR